MTFKNILIATVIASMPAAAMAQDWAGAYAGAQIGGSDIDVDPAPLDGDGSSYGVFAGYSIQSGSIVYGGEIDYDVTEYDIGDGAVEVDSTTRLKARLGTEVGGGLLYGTGGVVFATSPELGDDNGILVGIGYDLPVGNGITVGGEVLQHQFEDYNDSGLDVGVTTFKARIALSF